MYTCSRSRVSCTTRTAQDAGSLCVSGGGAAGAGRGAGRESGGERKVPRGCAAACHLSPAAHRGARTPAVGPLVAGAYRQRAGCAHAPGAWGARSRRQTPLLRLTPAKQVLLASLASCDDLKCRVFSALARCYSLAGAGQKKELGALRSGRELAAANRKRLAATHRRAARALACRPSRRSQPAVDGLGAALWPAGLHRPPARGRARRCLRLPARRSGGCLRGARYSCRGALARAPCSRPRLTRHDAGAVHPLRRSPRTAAGAHGFGGGRGHGRASASSPLPAAPARSVVRRRLQSCRTKRRGAQQRNRRRRRWRCRWRIAAGWGNRAAGTSPSGTRSAGMAPL